MPTAEEIHAGLTLAANEWIALAIAWHVALTVALVALIFGWRPTHRRAAVLIALLPASVAATAIAFGNPFNAIVLGGTSIALIALGWRERRGALRPGRPWSAWAGTAMIAFGWIYPHFLAGEPWRYLIAAPVGLVPCPTLSVAIGFALLADGAGRPAWRLALAGVGAFYALFGVLRLGVVIDLGLLAGAVALAATLRSRRPVALAPAAAAPAR